MIRAKRGVFVAALFLTAGVFASAQFRAIYSDTANPRAEIAQAIHTASQEHKRIILDFGGNWCGDCQVLDIYLHEAPNDALVEKHFVVVHIDIGRQDKNLDVAEKYGVDPKIGVPAVAVLDPHGHLLYSKPRSIFTDMRSVDLASVTDFLNKWKN